MTKFNAGNIPEDKLTYGDVLSPIFQITEKEDAKQYKQAYIDFIRRSRQDIGASAEEVVNKNIAYFAAYGSAEDRKRVTELFECGPHPIFRN